MSSSESHDEEAVGRRGEQPAPLGASRDELEAIFQSVGDRITVQLSVGALGRWGLRGLAVRPSGRTRAGAALARVVCRVEGEIDDALAEGDDARAVGCVRRLLALGGSAPTARLAAVMEAALGCCCSLRRSIVDAEDERSPRLAEHCDARRTSGPKNSFEFQRLEREEAAPGAASRSSSSGAVD